AEVHRIIGARLGAGRIAEAAQPAAAADGLRQHASGVIPDGLDAGRGAIAVAARADGAAIAAVAARAAPRQVRLERQHRCLAAAALGRAAGSAAAADGLQDHAVGLVAIGIHAAAVAGVLPGSELDRAARAALAAAAADTGTDADNCARGQGTSAALAAAAANRLAEHAVGGIALG